MMALLSKALSAIQRAEIDAVEERRYTDRIVTAVLGAKSSQSYAPLISLS